MKRDFMADLGIQSWCFRTIKETSGVIKALKACGVRNVELCGAHVDVAKNAGQVLKAFEDAGIRISVYGVTAIGDDEAAARKAFEFAALAGFQTLSADLRDGGLETAERLCAEYGKRIAIHNHGRKHAFGPVKALENLFAKSSPNIGLCLDTAWMLDSGEEPVAVAEKFKDRLYGIHVKDFIFDRAGTPEDVVVGTGNLQLDKLASLLKRIDYAGYLTLEYEGDPANPVPALKKCVKAIKDAFASLT